MKIKAFIIALTSALVLASPAFTEEYISTFDMNGNLINSFAAGIPNDQYISFIEVDPNGDIWIGKIDSGHGANQFNPNDQVIRFSPNGIQQQVVKGPTRNQTAIGFDSSFNLYIGANPDGGALGDNYIYVFDQNGTYDTFFVNLNDNVEDLQITPGDRIFAVTNNTMMLNEFNTAGTRLNNYQVNNFMGRYMALNGSETRLWCFQAANGAPENLIVEYDLDLVNQSSFGLNSIGNPMLDGIEVLASGNLLALDGDTGAAFYEFGTTGTLVDTFTLPDLTSAQAFTLDNQENIIVVHSNSLLGPTSIPTMNEWGMIIMSLMLAGTAFWIMRRRQMY
jgi:sugar lactone lactonase YvrE